MAMAKKRDTQSIFGKRGHILAGVGERNGNGRQIQDL